MLDVCDGELRARQAVIYVMMRCRTGDQFVICISPDFLVC